MHPSVRDTFRADLSTAQAAVRSGVVVKRSSAASRQWHRWVAFCSAHSVDPWFPEGDDPIPYLQVFAARYRDGRLAPSGKPVRSATVADALRDVGQAYQAVGAHDIRLNAQGEIDFRLKRQLRSYTKADPPSQRVKPIPIQVVQAVLLSAHQTAPPDDAFLAVADMTCLGFFFMLRPGEHTFSATNTPFRLQDVKLYLGTRRLDLSTASPAEFVAATSVSLTFTTQKNGVKGEVISHGRSGHPLCCPVRAAVRRVRYLLARGFPPTAPLCRFTDRGRTRHVTAAQITLALRAAILLVDPASLDILPDEVEARSLRAGGATALLCAGIDNNTIQLLGRWKSDAMLRYLHISASPVMNRYAAFMYNNGAYTFTPGTTVPQHPA